MNHAFPRRQLLKISTALPMMSTLSSWARGNCLTPQQTYITQVQGSLYLVKTCAPFEQNVLLEPGCFLSNGAIFTGKEALLKCEHLSTPTLHIFVTVSASAKEKTFRFFRLDCENFTDANVNLIGELSSGFYQNSASISLQENELLYFVMEHDQSLLVWFLNSDTLNFSIFSLNRNGDWKRFFLDNFKLPQDSSLHLLPTGVLSDNSPVFLLCNDANQSQDFL